MKNKIIVLLSVFIFCMTLGAKDASAIQNVITVAKSGGDFTSVQAAIDSVNPTADNPYLINVMPGTYVENITMKSYIHLQGAGRDLTTIQISGGAISGFDLTGVVVSGFTIKNGNYGLYFINTSSVTVTDNTFTGSYNPAIDLYACESCTITNNIITQTGNYGIVTTLSSNLKIKGNTISNNLAGLSPGGTAILITHNEIIGNTVDISVNVGSDVNISFNVIDTIQNGRSAKGQYNVKSDGSAASLR